MTTITQSVITYRCWWVKRKRLRVYGRFLCQRLSFSVPARAVGVPLTLPWACRCSPARAATGTEARRPPDRMGRTCRPRSPSHLPNKLKNDSVTVTSEVHLTVLNLTNITPFNLFSEILHVCLRKIYTLLFNFTKYSYRISKNQVITQSIIQTLQTPIISCKEIPNS